MAAYFGLDKLPPERLIYLTSIFLLSVSGLGVIGITSYNKVSKSHIQLALTRSLWKFESATNKQTMYEEKCWSWRKLVLAGVMSCSLTTTLTVKLLAPPVALTIAAALFTSWMTGILCYWYLIVVKTPKSSEKYETTPISPETSNAGVVDQAWFSRKLDTANLKDTRLPLTIITGFLGSGKTTLVKNVLQNTVGMKVLVVENEIGAEGIDHELLMQQTGKEEIILMNNGCVCCTVRKDLLTTFHRMFSHEAFAQLDWIVIETTGMADPAPLIQSLYMDPDCQARIRLDSVLTVVDCKHLPLHLNARAEEVTSRDIGVESGRGSGSAQPGGAGGAPRTGLQALFNITPAGSAPPSSSGTLTEAALQITFADRVLMNKTDLVSEAELHKLMATVQKINPSAQLIACENAVVPLEDILNIRAFDPLQNKALTAEFSSGDTSTSSASTTSAAPLLIQVDAAGQIVRKTVKLNQRKSKLSPAAAKILSERSKHDVQTVSLVAHSALDLDLFNHWISRLLGDRGGDIYRMKGILWMHGYEEQFVVHGVHMIFDGQRGQRWDRVGSGASSGGGERDSGLSSLGAGRKGFSADNAAAPARFCRLVFIGLGLDRVALEADFLRCMHSTSAKA